MMQTFHGHKSMQFWYMSQIKLTLTSDSIYIIAKTNSNPWDYTEKKKTPPVLGHGVNFVRKSNKTVYFQRYTPNREVKSHELLYFRTLYVLLGVWCCIPNHAQQTCIFIEKHLSTVHALVYFYSSRNWQAVVSISFWAHGTVSRQK